MHRNKKLLGAPGLSTRNKAATRGSLLCDPQAARVTMELQPDATSAAKDLHCRSLQNIYSGGR